MKKTITSLLLVWAIGSCGTSFLQAQTAVEKGLKSISRPSAEAIVGFLADDVLQGREAGMIGSRVAARYLVSCLQEAGIAPLYDDSYYQPFEACAKERQQKGRWQVHPDSIAQLKQGTHRSLRMANVLGMIPGERTNEYVVVGAHFDHLGIDETLAGDKIYNGADDNASGVSAVMQIARAFQASGKKPLRNVIIAFWDGEGQSLVFICDNCKKQFSIRIGKSKLNAANRKEEVIDEKEGIQDFGNILAVENVFAYKQVLPLHEGDNLIGRRCKGNDIDIPIESNDPSLDRRHCYINVKKNKQGKIIYTLRDNDSITGTFLMNEILGPKDQIRIEDGAIITLGATTLILRAAEGQTEE